MKTVTINPSIALIVNIDSVSFIENRNIFFTASENWSGDFNLKIFNSHQKNSLIVDDELVIEDKKMTMTINPNDQGLIAGSYYYEIFSVKSESIIFKGDLKITK